MTGREVPMRGPIHDGDLDDCVLPGRAEKGGEVTSGLPILKVENSPPRSGSSPPSKAH